MMQKENPMLKHLIGTLLIPTVTEFGIALQVNVTTESGHLYHVEIEQFGQDMFDITAYEDSTVLVQNGNLNFTTGSTFIEALCLADDAIEYGEIQHLRAELSAYA
jgi:hypothetical protein